MKGRILPRSFYARPTVEVARDLLGKYLVHGGCAGVIVETEAYLGTGDIAAHSAAGITDRTRVIFGPPGHAYVYLSYGMHECFNITAEQEGEAGCVLIRALEPVAGLDTMRTRRPGAIHSRDLANGPGKLAKAMGITRGLYGRDLTRGDFVVRDATPQLPVDIAVTPRIGITKSADLPLRFFIRNSPYASRHSQ
ncbi:MAG TPA: DNA-3-methyladenine glycosylase [Bryobacteraceae bacterium]|nr:DNA-3-methyladenine glycosylase [Bryobacteraceae bacterium]